MSEPLLLDRTALRTFEICPRRFQLRYLLRLPWPSSPLERRQTLAVERGRLFHQLMERHFLALPVREETITDRVVREWWLRFLHSDLNIPGGRHRPEHRLTIPAGNHFLTGRFDLVVTNTEQGRVRLRLFDWKTSEPRSAAALRDEWQTRLYLALAAESGGALAETGSSVAPDDISLTYWYRTEPDRPRVLPYSSSWHAQNWSYIHRLLESIDAALEAHAWPLTPDLSRCRACMYQAYCGRQEAGRAAFLAEEAAAYGVEDAVSFEPRTP